LKLKDVRVDDRPDSNKPKIMTSIETVDRLISDVLSGGYNTDRTEPDIPNIKPESK